MRRIAPGRPWRNLAAAQGGPPTDDAGACPAAAVCYGVHSTTAGEPSFDGDSYSTAMTGPTGTWSGQAHVPDVLIFDIACSATRTCYTAGYGGSITVTTNGSTFSRVSSPTRDNLYAITCPTGSACYAVGAKGAILAR
jgi:hypothetical protein